MSYAIKIHSLGGRIEGFCIGNPEGQFVKTYDPDGHDGRGDVVGTYDISEAAQFDTVEDAMRFYRQPSKVRPLRPDGRPNCPLTAFTVELVPIN